ncbi:MAG: hypothetical protein ABW292_22595 [Vicinamibacterales bacterium]
MRFVTSAARDAQHGWRILWRSPGYAAVVILTIALGIGANVTIFSVIQAVLWRSLPYPDAGRLVAIEADTRDIPSAYSACAAESQRRAEQRQQIVGCAGRRDPLRHAVDVDRRVAAFDLGDVRNGVTHLPQVEHHARTV